MIVNKPPDLTNATQYEMFMDMVDEFENGTTGSQGPDFTFLWLRMYRKFLNIINSKFVALEKSAFEALVLFQSRRVIWRGCYGRNDR